MKVRRTAVMLVIRSHAESGRSTAPNDASPSSLRSNSGRTGGTSLPAPVILAASAIVALPMVRLQRRFLDALGEQHVVDAALQRLERLAALMSVVEFVGVQLGL